MIMITVIIVSIAALPWGGIRQGQVNFSAANSGENPTVVADQYTLASSWITEVQQTSPGN